MNISCPVWFTIYELPSEKMVPKCKTSMKIIKGGGKLEIVEGRPAIISAAAV